MPAPASEPALHPAWKRGITVRRRRRSTSAASTFMATSQTPMPMPWTKSPAAARGTLPTTAPAAAVERPTVSASTPPRTVAAAPMRSMTRPVLGSASKEPAEMASSRVPSPPLESSRRSRRSGSRETRLAKTRPLSTNERATAFRATSRDAADTGGPVRVEVLTHP